jgi:hypothetical protein
MFCILYRAQSPIADWGIKKLNRETHQKRQEQSIFFALLAKNKRA